MFNAHLTTTARLCHRTIITKLCPMPTVPDCTQCPPQHHHSRCSLHCYRKAKQAWHIPHHIFISQYTFHTNFIRLPIMPDTLGVTRSGPLTADLQPPGYIDSLLPTTYKSCSNADPSQCAITAGLSHFWSSIAQGLLQQNIIVCFITTINLCLLHHDLHSLHFQCVEKTTTTTTTKKVLTACFHVCLSIIVSCHHCDVGLQMLTLTGKPIRDHCLLLLYNVYSLAACMYISCSPHAQACVIGNMLSAIIDSADYYLWLLIYLWSILTRLTLPLSYISCSPHAQACVIWKHALCYY